jgi:hypothetical protein
MSDVGGGEAVRDRLARVVLGGVVTLTVAGCSLVPNMDHGSAGCSNATGIGPRDQNVVQVGTSPIPGLIGLDPTAAANKAAALGHTVVFNVQTPGFGECWCVPPPEGTVTGAFFTSNGALMLMIEGVDEGHSADEQPFAGWGC